MQARWKNFSGTQWLQITELILIQEYQESALPLSRTSGLNLKDCAEENNHVIKPHERIKTKLNMIELTSLHEAAHVVLSYLSSYHFLTGDIRLTSDSTGETFVTLSRRKLLLEGKEISVDTASDPEVIEDAAIIFYAGLEAERIYCEQNNISLDESHSANDYNYVDQLIDNSNPPFETNRNSLIAFSHQAVLANWEPITQIAEFLQHSHNNSVDAITAIEILDEGFGNNSFQ
jgi:hypothetical protein